VSAKTLANATLFHSFSGIARLNFWLETGDGHVIAQAVSRRLPAAATRVRSHFKSCGIVALGQFSPTALHSPAVVLAWCNTPVSGLSLTPTPRDSKKTEHRRFSRQWNKWRQVTPTGFSPVTCDLENRRIEWLRRNSPIWYWTKPSSWTVQFWQMEFVLRFLALLILNIFQPSLSCWLWSSSFADELTNELT
jgi:hypothetical protein